MPECAAQACPRSPALRPSSAIRDQTRAQVGHIRLECAPKDLVIDPMVDMVDEDPDVAYVVPGDAVNRRSDLLGEFARRVGDPADDRFSCQTEHQIQFPRCLSTSTNYAAAA